jgi:NADPH-dependent ferric siderophore reductase
MLPQLVRVSRVDRITPRTVRITLADADIVCPTPDSYVKLFFPLAGERVPRLAPPVTADVVTWYQSYLSMPDGVRPPMRTYTVRATRPSEMDIDFVLHGDDGPASGWAASAKPGDTIAFLGPTGVPSALDGNRLLIGDHSSLPAIGSIIESASAEPRAIVELSDPAERQDFPVITWVDDVVEALRHLPLDDNVQVWVAGESGMVRAARRLLIDRGISKRAIAFHGYWRKGMSEEDVGREGLRRIAAGLEPESW